MLLSWLIFPLLLLALCFGFGLLLETAMRKRLPGPLLLPVGFSALLVVVAVVTARGETAPLATPAAVILALLGFILTLIGRTPRAGKLFGGLDGWVAAAALGVFLAYAAPVVLSGHPTFTGYIKLDDTATWLAFVDQVMSHGRDLSNLEASSYRTTLEVNLPNGYPVGAFLPLGVGAKLLPSDAAWLVQPYMATMAALLALCLYWLATSLLDSRALRALVAFGAAQPALLYAYGLWGGIKEVAVALVLATLAAVAPAAAEDEDRWRAALPAALATTALLAMVGSGGLVWIAPVLGLMALALWRRRGLGAVLRRAAPLILIVVILAIPVIFAAGVFSPTQGGLTSDAELGNLFGPLNLAQYAGIWPTGDFRLDPVNGPLTIFLLALAVLAAAAGLVLGRRGRPWAPLLYVVGAGVGSLAVFAYSSPWVGGKALASGSPSFLFLALVGAALFAVRVERVLGATALGLILAGVLWSNALGYHDVSLAPYQQLRELESIGEEFADEGPTLMTEYQPYGVRHFLRATDAEGASELRYRPIPLIDGGELEKGEWGDTDQFTLPALLTYRTLVLRRSPAQSRPPSIYSLVRSGEYYDVWQQKEATVPIAEHVPLGSFEDPGSEACAEVLRAAEAAGPAGEVAAVERGPTVSASLGESTHPSNWTPTEPGSPDLVPRGEGEAGLLLDVPKSGRYDLYLQGSVRNRLILHVDGEEVGSVEQQLNAGKQFLYFGRHRLGAGEHEVVLSYGGQTVAPGSGGPPEPIGPLVASSIANQDPPVLTVPAAQARSLCGKHLDWVEVLP
jgi:hypothetical protein